MVESRVPQAIDAVCTMCKNAGLPVFDGPVITGDANRSALFIGYDGGGEEGSDFNATDTTQAWAGIGLRRRNEDYSIVCSIIVFTGDTGSWKNARDAAFGLLDQVGELLRATPSLGLSSPSTAELMPGAYFQEPGPRGYQARIVFTIHHDTRV